MISVKVFELSAGPRAANVVRVNSSGSIASELHALSAALDEAIEFSAVTFHTIREKKIHNVPLATDKSFAELGIVNGSYIIVRRKKTTVGAAKGAAVVKMSKVDAARVDSVDPSPSALVQDAPLLGQPHFSAVEAPIVSEEERLRTMDAELTCQTAALRDKLMLSLVKEVENVKQETLSLWESKRADLVHEQAKFEQERLLELQVTMTRQIEQQHAIERAMSALQEETDSRARMLTSVNSIQHANEKLSEELMTVRQKVHAGVQESLSAIMSLQGRIEESVRLLLPLSKSDGCHRHGGAAVESRNAEDGPTSHPSMQPIPSAEDLAFHETLLQQFFDAVGQTRVSSSDVLSRFRAGDVYDAVSLKYNLGNNIMQDAVREYLRSRTPHMAPAAPIICFVHDGHEVEFLEWVTLKSIGRTQRSPHTWLEVMAHDGLAGSIVADTHGSYYYYYYYSSVVGLSQRKKPSWLQSVDIRQCHLPAPSSICPRLGLRNRQWTECDDAYRNLQRSKAAAIILLQRPDLYGNMDAILKFYTGKEETLLKLLVPTR